MKDKISEDRVNLLHPKAREDFRNFVNDAEAGLNITLRVVQGFRTMKQQDAIYQQGRTTPGPIVTHSPAGASYHNYGLAVDVALMKDDGSIDWSFDDRKLLPYSNKYALKWGGNWSDKPHFEKNFGFNWRVLLSKYQAKDFITGTEFVNI
jgi:D-alanyl-D-alanine dipeptidase